MCFLQCVLQQDTSESDEDDDKSDSSDSDDDDESSGSSESDEDDDDEVGSSGLKGPVLGWLSSAAFQRHPEYCVFRYNLKLSLALSLNQVRLEPL